MEVIYLVLAMVIIALANVLPWMHFSAMDRKISAESKKDYHDSKFWESIDPYYNRRVVFAVRLSRPSRWQRVRRFFSWRRG